MIYFTSDTHFFHDKMMWPEYCGRPFLTVEEMNETIIANWNKTVSVDDTVYHLGDFSWKGINTIKTVSTRLNGKIILTKGNHDYLTNTKWLSIGIDEVKKFDIVEDWFVGHYPMFNEIELNQNCANRNEHDGQGVRHWHKDYKEAFLASGCKKILHGHLHKNIFHNNEYFHLNVGSDRWDFTPISLDAIKKEYSEYIEMMGV